MANKKSSQTRREQRSMRTQQIVFAVIGVIIILAMVLSMISVY